MYVCGSIHQDYSQPRKHSEMTLIITVCLFHNSTSRTTAAAVAHRSGPPMGTIPRARFGAK